MKTKFTPGKWAVSIPGGQTTVNARIRFKNGSELGDMVLPLERLQNWHRKIVRDWPTLKANLVAEWRYAIAEYRKAKATVKAMTK